MIVSSAINMILRTWIAFGLIVLWSIASWGQVSTAQRQAITDSLREAAANLDLDQLDDIDEAKRLVVRRASELIAYVDRSTDQKNAAAWLKYLNLDPLIDAIEDDESMGKIYAASLSLKQRLYGTAPGLENAPFRALRDALDRLTPALKYSRKDRAKKLLIKKIETDADDLDAMESIPTVDQLNMANSLLALLNETNQPAAASEVLRRSFRYPNLSVWVGEGVVQRVVNQRVNRTEPVIDCIMGTSINGQATLTGQVSADLFPSQGSVGVRVSLSGQVVSRNRGYRKPVSLVTTGYGDVSASRALYISETGISMEPTVACAFLRTEINSINHRFRFVRRIARRKAAESKPQADRIAVEKMRLKICTQFSAQVDQASNIQQPDVMQKVRPVLQRLDIPEPARLIGSTDESIYLHTSVLRQDQLAAPNPAPSIHRSYDAAIQIHETAINNTIGYLLAGRTINQKQIDRLTQQIGISKPNQSGASVMSEEKKQSDETSDDEDEDEDEDEDDDGDDEDEAEPPFEVDFDKVRPVIFEARDGKIRIGVRGTRFEQGTRVLKNRLEIAAVYVPGTTPDGVVILVRQGDVEIEFPGYKRHTTMQAAIKGAIEKNFATVFPESLLHQPIVLPSTIKAETLRGQVYRPRMIQADDGWLTVTLQ